MALEVDKRSEMILLILTMPAMMVILRMAPRELDDGRMTQALESPHKVGSYT